jgi:methyl-accepting chemotaxis protein
MEVHMNLKLLKIKSIRTALIGMVIATVVILEAINITFGASNLKTGIEYETMQGLNAACLSYAQVLNITEHNDSIDNSTLEADLNNSTGYEYTYFLGNIRERSSIDGVVGTEANEDI